MPQIYVEYSDNITMIDFKEILKRINISVAKLVDVPSNRCKGRLIAYKNYLIGDGENSEEAFIFIHVGIQSSRSTDLKEKIGNVLLEILKEYAQPKLKAQKLKCSPRVEVHYFDLYLFSDWTS